MDSNEHGRSPIRVIVDSIPPATPPSNEQQDKQERQEKRDSRRLCVEIATALLLLVYTVVTYCLWNATRQANAIATKNVEQADRNFRQSERAWMGFALPEGMQIQRNPTNQEPQALLIPTQTINTGKSVAKNVAGRVVITVIDKGEKLTFNFDNYSHYPIEGGAVFPNGQIGLAQPAVRRGTDGLAKTIVPTNALLRRIESAESFAVVFGDVSYCDIFGVSHKTTFCRYVTRPGFIDPDCMKYNNTDNNQEADRDTCPSSP